MTVRALASSLFVLAAVSVADARPKGEHASVQAHVERAAKAHKAGNFEGALEELKAAYAIDPQPKLLYAIAQVYAKLDDCTAAIEHYEKFLEADKDRSKRAVVQQAIDACKQKLAAAAAAEPPAPAEAEPTPPIPDEPAPPPRSAESRPAPPPVAQPPIAAAPAPADTPAVAITTHATHSPWYRDVLGDALVLGGIGAGVGAYLAYRGAQRELDDAERATTLADYQAHRDTAKTNQLITVALASGGLALVGAGIARYVLRDDTRETRSVAIVPLDGGGFITWSGGF